MQSACQEYTDGERTFEAYVAHDGAGGRRPCVLVAHQWAGQSDYERGKADELAGMGYVGFAMDVYGKGVRGGLMDNNSALMGPLTADRALLRRRLLAAVAAARAHPLVDPDRVAAIGYCFGGLCALDMARGGAPGLRGVVSFHGILSPPDLGLQPPIRTKVLILHGYADPMAPPQDVLAIANELTNAEADWQLHAYGHAMHAFTAIGVDAPERGLRYDPAAARRSWIAMTNFLDEVLA